MFIKSKLSVVALLTVLEIAIFLSDQPTNARGGGGGRSSVGRGGFDKGGFDRGGNDRNFSNDFGRTDRSYYGDGAGVRSPEAARADTIRTPDAANNGWREGRSFGGDRGALDSKDMAARGDAVRHAYDHRDCFDDAWWGCHRGAYYYPWMGGGYCWGATGWPMLAGFWGMDAYSAPIDYDYGNNITYQGNMVYYGSDPSYTATEYAQQASDLAQLAPCISASVSTTTETKVSENKQPENKIVELPDVLSRQTEIKKTEIKEAQNKLIEAALPATEQQKDWKPLGVFSLVQGGQTDTSKVFQLMVNKDGFIHGNFYDTMTDEVKPLTGAVDKKSMRAAWTIKGIKDVVYDTGISNLLKSESPILIHFGKDRTQQWTLVRLEDPAKKKT